VGAHTAEDGAHERDHPRYGLQHEVALAALKRTIGCERIEERAGTGRWSTTIASMRSARMADDSVDLVVTSIPFGNHYEYSRELQRLRPHRRSRATSSSRWTS
jgi:hypothetical protein